MDKVQTYIDSVEEPLQPIVIELRRLIKHEAPQLVEGLKWQVPTYSLQHNICSIMAHKNHVNLQLFQGANLDAVDSLDGIGDAMRHLKFYELGEIDPAEVALVLQQAIALDSDQAGNQD